MPNSVSNVRGLERRISFDDPGETPEQMMTRVDRDEVEAVCRHLIGRPFDSLPREPVGAGRP